jgi:hypothetical protein
VNGFSTRSALVTGALCAAALGAGAVLATQALAAPAPAVEDVALARPPEGARARIAVSPNPARSGDTVTLTGDCGGSPTLKGFIGGIPGHEILTDITVIDPNPDAFRATATLGRVGYGAGPVFVECDGELGVTILVTRPAA